LFKLDDRDLWCIANHYAGYCRELSEYIDEDKFVNERHPDCQLVEVKTPHGRLIDADELGDRMHGKWTIYDYEALGKSPTVIEAER
jgi:hypothetical protein